ncbi:response regulator [Pontibacter sp. Tf4]|uniref:response regulator n=1 Tax=Pontibacter sp. Tf4 TaxID=2761620 RepID=UPI001626377E|nr:response regulator [Pontibacter sp. Tf4]MBB6612419.1 response regulator [Pontibacter sp. Tf4]
MNFIKNLKIRDKLLLLLLLLLIPVMYFAVTTIQEQVAANDALQLEALQLEESEKISELVHVLQKERARILMVAYGDSAYLAEANSLRAATDRADRDLKDFLAASNRQFPDLARLNEMQTYRQALDKNELDEEKFRAYSADLIFQLLDRINDNANGISNLRITQQLQSFRNLAEAKIHLGRMRSLLMRVLQDDSFSHEEFAQFMSQLQNYRRMLVLFNRGASPEALKSVQAVQTTDNYKKVSVLLQSLENNPQQSLEAYEAGPVFDIFTRSIEDYRTAENELIRQIRTQVLGEIAQKEQNMTILVISIVALLVLVTILSIYIINLISTSLAALKTAAERIKLGATDVKIDIYSSDEIGSVASSFRGVINKSVVLANVAQTIGEGRYDVEVPVQSKEDVLSLAIRDMKDNLHVLTTENANRNWVLSGVAELNNQVSSETSVERVAEKAITFLSHYTDAETGILYLHNSSGRLAPVAAHGVPVPLQQLPVFEIGSGKVGQAVRERQVLVLDNVPDEYLRIRSGLAEVQPASVVIVPLYFGRTIVGALELCSRQPHTPLQQRFLDAVAERLSVVIHTLQAHLQTQELLYETQNQAEELETQQEELRQLNAELKASEEELRVNQEELQEKNTELEEKAQLLEEQYEALGVKNKALEDAREAIELKMQQVEQVSKYKSDFLANMSHELRTPLNSILILSRLLADNVENTLSTKQIDHAQIIHKSGNDLLRLINEILDLSKIESGVVKLETEEVKLDDIKMEPIFREMAARKKIRYNEKVAHQSFDTIVTDRFRLEQVLKNFIGNAIKFTDEGGEVELSIYEVKQRPAFKSEQLREQPEVVAFAVRDTGIGIPADKLDVVFEAFQQADTSTTRKYGGTGLGLTISKELATLLGGEVMVESEPGKGSTFTLYLPREPRVTEAKKPQPVKQTNGTNYSRANSVSKLLDKVEQQPGKLNEDVSLLIVEDDKGFSDILADFARSRNFKVHQAYTGTDGLNQARVQRPDAMLLDIQLPDMSGWDVLKQLREDKALRKTNVHVMSAYDKEVIGAHEGHEEYLPKPVTLEMLNKAFTTIADSSGTSIRNVLIVEDNEIENKAVSELLLAHGIKSASAYTAEEAEQVLAKQKVDCIILDLNLPGMKGYDWMKKLKANPGLSDIPIIIYSGKDLSEDEENALRAFANTVIIKNEYSYLRLLDEVQLFLHRVNQKLPAGPGFKMKLHVPEEVLKGKRVLVVDDDVRNIYSLSSLLEMNGMEVAVAYNGKEALEKLQQEEEIDIVLMDVMMPEMDGIEATKRIRAISRFKQLPVIALTAKAMKEDREKCLQAGASDYIPKPVDTDKLLTLMRVWLYEA